MSGYVWIQPGTKNRYVTAVPNDPNVPAGYILSNTGDGSLQCVDGLTDQNMQTLKAGLASGGFPSYYGYTDGLGSDTNVPNNPNGWLGANMPGQQ